MKKIDSRTYTAARLYVERQMGRSRPQGRCDKGGRWYPDAAEHRPCCDKVRTPSRRWPWSIYRHCHSAAHIAALYDVDQATMLRLAKRMARRCEALTRVYKQALIERRLASLEKSDDGGVIGYKWLVKDKDGKYSSPVRDDVWEGDEMYACPEFRESGRYGIYFFTSRNNIEDKLWYAWYRCLVRICAHGRIEIDCDNDGVAMCEYAHIIGEEM